MKKLISVIISFALVFSLAGCGFGGSKGSDDGKLKIITTIFPVYDWVHNIVKDSENVELSLLLDTGVDMHSYQPSAEDILKISECDVFAFVGGESDKWADEAIKDTGREITAIKLLDELGAMAKEEELAEGMQDDGEEEEDGEVETEYDEHVWLSLKNASALCGKISEKLCELDRSNSALYKSNTEKYVKKLNELDGRYEKELTSAKHNAFIFADRFPFRYLADDYKIKYYAAFSGCSAETEASFETIKFLADKLTELKLSAVLTIDGSDKKIADTVVKTSGRKDAQVLTVNSMQSSVMKNFENGETYLGIMEDNLRVFGSALN